MFAKVALQKSGKMAPTSPQRAGGRRRTEILRTASWPPLPYFTHSTRCTSTRAFSRRRTRSRLPGTRRSRSRRCCVASSRRRPTRSSTPSSKASKFGLPVVRPDTLCATRNRADQGRMAGLQLSAKSRSWPTGQSPRSRSSTSGDAGSTSYTPARAGGSSRMPLRLKGEQLGRGMRHAVDRSLAWELTRAHRQDGRDVHGAKAGRALEDGWICQGEFCRCVWKAER